MGTLNQRRNDIKPTDNAVGKYEAIHDSAVANAEKRHDSAVDLIKPKNNDSTVDILPTKPEAIRGAGHHYGHIAQQSTRSRAGSGTDPGGSLDEVHKAQTSAGGPGNFSLWDHTLEADHGPGGRGELRGRVRGADDFTRNLENWTKRTGATFSRNQTAVPGAATLRRNLRKASRNLQPLKADPYQKSDKATGGKGSQKSVNHKTDICQKSDKSSIDTRKELRSLRPVVPTVETFFPPGSRGDHPRNFRPFFMITAAGHCRARAYRRTLKGPYPPTVGSLWNRQQLRTAWQKNVLGFRVSEGLRPAISARRRAAKDREAPATLAGLSCSNPTK